MLPFMEYHIYWILNGIKDMTRRRWKRRKAKPGAIHFAQVSQWRPDTRFARLEILEVYQERLGDMTDADAKREGPYKTVKEFRKAWIEINGSWDDDEVVWVVVFRVHEDLTGTVAPNGKVHQHGGWKCFLCGKENEVYQDSLEGHLQYGHGLSWDQAKKVKEPDDVIPYFLRDLDKLTKQYNVVIDGMPVLDQRQAVDGKYQWRRGLLQFVK